MGRIIHRHENRRGANLPQHGGVASFCDGHSAHPFCRRASSQTICISQRQRVVVFCAAWLFGNFLPPVAAIQWTADGASHHHRLDHHHIAGVHCRAGVAGLEREVKTPSIAGHCACHVRRAGCGQQGRLGGAGGREFRHNRRFSHPHQFGQLGGVFHPFAARIKESPVHADDVLGDDPRLVVHVCRICRRRKATPKLRNSIFAAGWR